jgi:hypothetical protein
MSKESESKGLLMRSKGGGSLKGDEDRLCGERMRRVKEKEIGHSNIVARVS